LLASWDSLPVRQRNELIQYRWEQVGGPEWLPVLRGIVASDPTRNRESEKLDRTPALRHVYELAPDQGRELILREISDPKGDIGINVLGLLPDRELPQIEQPLIARLRSGNDRDIEYQLLERYASSHALPEVKSIYEAHRGAWACAPQTAMLRYFLRVSPDYGVEQVGDALSQRKLTGCYKTLLTSLREEIRRPNVENLAIRSLGEASPELAANAADALGGYGSAKAEAALWRRLEGFHDQWKDRTDELRYRPGLADNLKGEIVLEEALVYAIAAGQAWFTSEETVHRLKHLTIAQFPGELDNVFQEIQDGQYALNLNWWPEGALTYTVGRYHGTGMPALKEKLTQFPAGTHLDLITTAAERERHHAEFAEVENAAASAGLLLQIQTPQ